MKTATILFVTLLSLCLVSVLGAPEKHYNEQLAKYVDDIFYRYDANDDNYLDRNEGRRFFMDATGNEHVSDSDFTAWFRLIDLNKDGRLSWNEVYILTEASIE